MKKIMLIVLCLLASNATAKDFAALDAWSATKMNEVSAKDFCVNPEKFLSQYSSIENAVFEKTKNLSDAEIKSFAHERKNSKNESALLILLESYFPMQLPDGYTGKKIYQRCGVMQNELHDALRARDKAAAKKHYQQWTDCLSQNDPSSNPQQVQKLRSCYKTLSE